ncbi:MAG: hypothetical protein NPIRA06_32760 [Nitrospirales bacterium]|nr:MAG: hypothetical protein NPIRA06_32760 [Nitrospirales bacterium]
MQFRSLFIATAILEAATGLGLFLSPSAPVAFLIDAPLDTDGGFIVARIAGGALFSLAVACWFARNDGQSRSATGLGMAILLYNVAVVGVFLYAGIGLGLSGPGLWPAIMLHTVLAIWCLVCLRSGL